MSTKILQTKEGESCLYDSTTMTAFGPVFNKDEDSQEFLYWLESDPRLLTQTELADKYSEWLNWHEEGGRICECCGSRYEKFTTDDGETPDECPDCWEETQRDAAAWSETMDDINRGFRNDFLRGCRRNATGGYSL